MPCTHRSVFCTAIAGAVVIAFSAPVQALDSFPAPAGWPAYTAALTARELIGPGVSYEHWALTAAPAGPAANGAHADGPLSISIITADLTNPFVTLTAAAENGVVQGPGARLSAIADSIHAEAGVNGDYFDIGGSNAPINALIVDGRALHQPSAAAVFSIGADKRPHLGPVSWSAVVVPANGSQLTISGVNDWSASTPISLLTPELGNTDAYGATEAVLRPAEGGTAFTVVSVAENLRALATLGPDQIGIAGHGDAAASIAAAFTVGENVSVTYQGNPAPMSIVTAIGGGPLLVRDGMPYDDPAAPAPQERDVRYPLTGAGLAGDGRTLWLVVVDGRRPGVSVGVTRPMLGALFIALGASDAMAFDSGGSSEMVARHLGDPGVEVMTTPSDGRERAIADGLFIVNSGPAGPATQLLLRPSAPAVLAGSRLAVRAEAVDANLQPVALNATSLSWQVQPAGVLTFDDAGNAVAQVPGDATITAMSGAISATATVKVVPSISGLTISGYGATVPIGAKAQLIASAVDALGEKVAVDANAVMWSASSGATVAPSGEFAAGTAPAAVTVRATAGGATATALVDVGDHATPLESALPSGAAANAWRSSASSNASGGLDETPAPDGSSGLRLLYRFAAAGGTRAAYAASEVAVPGEPIAIACDVFGDGNGEWLRASYRDADGITNSITLARHVDWVGWRTLRAAVSLEARKPITVTRLYVVQPDKRAVNGVVWLRNLAAVYPGP
jgi:hypothetical protein